MHNNKNDKYLLPGSVLVGLLLIAGAVYWNGQHPSAGSAPVAAGTQPTPSPSVNVKDVKTAGEPFIGQANAPVTIVEWSDYQCPFCKQFETNTLPQIMSTYINTGKVKLVFKDFAFLGNDSITDGEYARSIWKLYPDKYFTWRTAMFTAQDQEGDVGFGKAATVDTLDATIPGIDAAKVAADVKTNATAYQALMDADKTEAGNFGVSATPSFIIGTQLLAGAYPYADFQTALSAVVGK